MPRKASKAIDFKATTKEIRADPKRYIGVLERAVKRRNEIIAWNNKIIAELRENVTRAKTAKLSREAKLDRDRVHRGVISRLDVIRKLKAMGWKRTRHGWFFKEAFRGITLREAASLAALSSDEDLGGY